MTSFLKNAVEKLIHQKIKILWGVALLLTIYFGYFTVTNADRPTHGFSSYYTASRLLAEGNDVVKFYNDDWFSSKVKKNVQEVYEIYHANLPTTSLIMLPLVYFDYSAARIIWTIFNFIILLVTVIFLIHNFNYKEYWLPLIIIVFLFFQPIYANFYYGQTYVLVLFFFTVGLYAYNSDKHSLLGISIGLVFVFKSVGILLWIFLLMQKRWKSLGWGLITVLFVVLSSLPWLGIDSWKTYLYEISNLISNPELSVTAYQTIHSFFHHLTSFDQQWNPKPLISLSVLGDILTTLTGLILLAAISYNAFKHRQSGIVFGIFIISGLILSPVSLDYHYTIILLPILILIKSIRKDSSVLIWLMLIFSVVFIALDFPYTSPRIANGALAIFAYPKLYGAIILLGLFLWFSKQQNALAKNESPV